MAVLANGVWNIDDDVVENIRLFDSIDFVDGNEHVDGRIFVVMAPVVVDAVRDVCIDVCCTNAAALRLP